MPTRSLSLWSGNGRPWKLAASLCLLVLALPPLSYAQRPERPPYYAIQGARIVPVSGPVIESGTVVVANGLIQAVGANVTVPPEAWVIDGSGLTVYPGLIDALTTLGLSTEQPARGGGGAGAGPPGRQAPQRAPRGPEDRAATTSWENAADKIKADDNRIKNWREGGFTTAVTSPERGIFPGQAAVINLAGAEPKDMIVKTPAALRVNMRGAGRRQYPGSLMGVIAYVKQLFLDADHYAQAWSTYESDPKGLQRPDYDRTLAPLADTKQSNRPVLLPGTQAREIHRALDIGEELGLRTVVYGAQQGYKVAGALAAKNASVLVSLKWPEKDKNADPELEESLRTLQFRDQAPTTPAELQKAGVRFGFYSDGLNSTKDIIKNVKKAIDKGLAADAALRALTLSPAEIFGVDDRLGSIESGKIANLVVADGDLFEEKTKIKMVFVDGEKYEIHEPSRPTEAPTVNLTGTWTLTVTTPSGEEERTAELTMDEDGTLDGSLTGRQGTTSITRGWVSGDKFSFTLSLTMRGRSFEMTYSGTAKEDSLEGTIQAGPRTMDFTGKRTGPGNDTATLAGR